MLSADTVKGDFQNIAELKKLIKRECDPLLNYCAAWELHVFAPRTKVEKAVDENGKPLDGGTKPLRPGAGVPCPVEREGVLPDDNPLIVVAPAPPPQQQQERQQQGPFYQSEAFESAKRHAEQILESLVIKHRILDNVGRPR